MLSLNSRPLRLLGVAAAVLLGVSASSARGDTINAFLLELTNSDPAANAIGVAIEIQDVIGGVQFSAELRDIPGPGLGEGDILALWFDINSLVDLSLVNHSPPYDPSDLNITGFESGHNTIGSAPWGDGGPNINGMPAPFAATSPYDIAMRFGSNGMGTDYYPSISFKLTNLTTGDFAASRFAARVTSVGDNNNASGKYGGFVEQPPVVPTPTAALGGLALAGLCVLRRTRAGV